MTKPDKWMPLYIADYLAATTRLSTEQHGAYLLLLMDYWRNGPPPDDDESLAAITRLPLPRWRQQRAAMLRLFTIEAGAWRQKRADKELTEWQGYIDQKSRAGKASAEAKAKRKGQQDTNGNSTVVDTSVATDGQQTAQPSPSPSSLRSEYSVPSEPPPVAANGADLLGDRPIDLKAEIWRRGKAFLGKHGVDAKQAGSLIGKWRRDYRDPAVLDALAACEAECASDPVPFIEATLRSRNGHPAGDRHHGRLNPETTAALEFLDRQHG